MDKARRPHVIRTWTVERTQVPYHQPQALRTPPNRRQETYRSPAKRPRTDG
jgi:hypothetical protein